MTRNEKAKLGRLLEEIEDLQTLYDTNGVLPRRQYLKKPGLDEEVSARIELVRQRAECLDDDADLDTPDEAAEPAEPAEPAPFPETLD